MSTPRDAATQRQRSLECHPRSVVVAEKGGHIWLDHQLTPVCQPVLRVRQELAFEDLTVALGYWGFSRKLSPGIFGLALVDSMAQQFAGRREGYSNLRCYVKWRFRAGEKGVPTALVMAVHICAPYSFEDTLC